MSGFSLHGGVLDKLQFTPIEGSIIENYGGLNVKLNIMHQKDDSLIQWIFGNLWYYSSKCLLYFGYYYIIDEEAILTDLRTNPKKVLIEIRRKNTIHPLKYLNECESCCAGRIKNPHIRAKVEKVVLDTAQNIESKDKLTIVVFGDSGLFQTFVLTQKLVDLKKWKNIELHLIDPIFANIIASNEEGAKPATCIGRLENFLNWFNQQSETKVDINIYHHASRYVFATQIKPDLFLSIDWIDELGLIGQGLTIQGDRLVVLLTLPCGTPIVDLQTPFEPQLLQYNRSIKESPFDRSTMMSDSSLENFIMHYMMDKNSEEEIALYESLFEKPNLIIKGMRLWT